MGTKPILQVGGSKKRILTQEEQVGKWTITGFRKIKGFGLLSWVKISPEHIHNCISSIPADSMACHTLHYLQPRGKLADIDIDVYKHREHHGSCSILGSHWEHDVVSGLVSV